MPRVGNKMKTHRNQLHSKLHNSQNIFLVLLTIKFLTVSSLVKALKVNISKSTHNHLQLKEKALCNFTGKL